MKNKKDTFNVRLHKESKYWKLNWNYHVPTAKFAELVAYLEQFKAKKQKDY